MAVAEPAGRVPDLGGPERLIGVDLLASLVMAAVSILLQTITGGCPAAPQPAQRWACGSGADRLASAGTGFRMIRSAPPPPKGFQVLTAPVSIPDVIPDIDLSQKVTDEADFSGYEVELFNAIAEKVFSKVVYGAEQLFHAPGKLSTMVLEKNITQWRSSQCMIPSRCPTSWTASMAFRASYLEIMSRVASAAAAVRKPSFITVGELKSRPVRKFRSDSRSLKAQGRWYFAPRRCPVRTRRPRRTRRGPPGN